MSENINTRNLHPAIKNSPLIKTLFSVRNEAMEANIGRLIRWKPKWRPEDGTALRDYIFQIRGIQSLYDGTIAYRAYAVNAPYIDTFGQPFRPSEIKFEE